MPLLEKLRNFLEANHAAYTHTVHPAAFTAREVASAEHLPAREVAKTVVVFGDNGYHMMVVPHQAGRFSGGPAHAGAHPRAAGHGGGSRQALSGLRAGRDATRRKPVRPSRVPRQQSRRRGHDRFQRGNASRCRSHADRGIPNAGSSDGCLTGARRGRAARLVITQAGQGRACPAPTELAPSSAPA